MRDAFGIWGAELGDDAFACAVAAGVVHLGWKEKKQSWRWGARDWAGIRRAWSKLKGSASALAEQWEVFAKTHAEFRVVMPSLERVPDTDVEFAIEVLRWVAVAEPRCTSVIADTSGSGVRVREWHWPLRVGIARGFEAVEIARLCSCSQLIKQLIKIEEIDGAHTPWDLLVVPGTLREALAILANEPGSLTARCVLVTGSEVDLPRPAMVAALTSVRRLVDAQAVLLANVAAIIGTGGNRAKEIERVAHLLIWTVEEVAHDLPVDVALFRAARRSDPNATPYVSGDLRFLDGTRPSRRLSHIAAQMEAASDEIAIALPETFRGPQGVIATEARSARAIGRDLLELAHIMDWRSESGAATSTVEILAAAARAFEGAAARSEARFLQVGARAVDGDRESSAWTRRLESGATYDLEVWIGPVRAGPLVLDEPFPELSEESDSHELEVMLSAPTLLGSPRMGKIQLPAVGKSTICRFRIHCRPSVKHIEALIVVFHRGRVLQMGVLRGALVAPAATAKEHELLRFERDAMPRRKLATLSARSVFGAAVIANHDDEGAPQRFGIVGNRVARIRLSDATTQPIVDRFNAALSSIASAPGDYAELRSTGTLQMLRELAQHGARLHEAIYNHNEIGPSLAKEPRIQIVTARVDAFLPLELAYRWDAPEDDAELCEGAEDALRASDGALRGACAVRCGGAGGTAKRLCPMGFWCLWKTIERFEHRVEATAEPADYSLLAEPIGARPTLPRPKFGLVAASKAATLFDTEAINHLLARVKAEFSDGASVATWEEWSTGIGASHPGLLVVLPHHVRKQGSSVLQIGAASELKSTLVRPKHVIGDPPPDPPPRPILLLLGCETEDATIPLERFPAIFQERGAAIVIGTIATVLGRHAGPVAEELVALLAEQRAHERSFGDLLVAARRKLLLGGKVMALALAGFGDADWRLQ